MVIDKETFLRKLVFIWFWIFSCTGFVFDECLPENFAPIGQYILILCDLMTVVLMALTIRHKIDVLIIISFLVISYVSSCMLNGYLSCLLCAIFGMTRNVTIDLLRRGIDNCMLS